MSFERPFTIAQSWQTCAMAEGRLDRFLCSLFYTKSHPTVGGSWSTITEKQRPDRETEPGSFQRDNGSKSRQNVPNQWFIHSWGEHICVLEYKLYHQGKVKRSVIKPDSVLQTEGFGFVQSYSSFLLGDAFLFPSATVTLPNHPHPSQLIKRSLTMWLTFPFHSQTIPWDKLGGRFNRCGRLQETWELSWAFPPSVWKLFITILALRVWKFDVLMKSGFTCKYGQTVFSPFFSPSCASKSYTNKVCLTSFFHTTSSAAL